MIKLLHIADIHIGMENYGRIDPATGSSTRLKDFLDTLDEAVDRAIAEPVDAVVVAGDIYKSRDPSPTHQREFARRVLKLSRAGIQVVIVAGNHDIPLAEGRATSVDIFSVLDLPNVTVTRRLDTHRVETRGGPLQIVALPWLTRGVFLKREDYRNISIEELLHKMGEMADARLTDLCSQLDPSVPAVLVGHAHVHGARVGAERMLTLGSDPVFNLTMLDRPNIDYVALGHIHKHQPLHTGSTPVVYSGSINRVDFSEEREDKGFVLVEVQRGSANWEFVPVKARPFITIRAEPETDNPTGEVLKAIEKRATDVPESVIRLQLVGPRSRLQTVDEREVRRALAEAEFVVPFQREYTDTARVPLLGNTVEGRTPLQLLETFLERKGELPADRRAALLAKANELMTRDPAEA
ncbi:MAG: exonuclease SbcCD subunit D [Chloroflexota bacterium]